MDRERGREREKYTERNESEIDTIGPPVDMEAVEIIDRTV